MYKVLFALLIALACAACDDAAVTSSVGELPDAEETAATKLGKKRPLNCISATGAQDVGSGELLIAACSGSDQTQYEERSFTFTEVLSGSSISRSSYSEPCNRTNPQWYNLAIGLERTVVCSDSDSGSQELSDGVTYEISSGESGFLARWPDASASAPDVYATAVGGEFLDHKIGCSSTALCTSTVALEAIKTCFGYLNSVSLTEGGDGPEGCGNNLQWGWDLPMPNTTDKSLVRVAFVSNSSTAYDWEYTSAKEQKSVNGLQLGRMTFAAGVSRPSSTDACTDYLVFGSRNGSAQFVVEGWSTPGVGIVKEPSECDIDGT